jgi:hypothetical protein
VARVRSKTETKLTPQQELFCCFYTQNEALFGNATLSYAEAYAFDLDSLSHERPCNRDLDEDQNEHRHSVECPLSEYDIAYQTCSSNGSRLLRSAKVQARVTALLNDMLRDDVVDSQLAKLILNADGPTRIAAIREYNKLRQRIIDKVDHTTGGQPLYLPSEILTKNNLGGSKSGTNGDRS